MKEKEVDKNGNTIAQDRYTVCVSSQVGCKVGCSFCLTAKGGFVRNLTVSEIVSQVWIMKKIKNFNDWITGKKEPTITQLEKISQKFYIPFYYF